MVSVKLYNIYDSKTDIFRSFLFNKMGKTKLKKIL